MVTKTLILTEIRRDHRFWNSLVNYRINEKIIISSHNFSDIFMKNHGLAHYFPMTVTNLFFRSLPMIRVNLEYIRVISRYSGFRKYDNID